jgi:predicted metal-binding membrane protein
MKLSRNIQNAITLIIFSISLCGWIILLANPGHLMTMEHCHITTSGPSAISLDMLLEMNPISSQLLGWGFMVIAMMLPKLILPIQLIYLQSFKRYRFINAVIFVSGYITIWMITGLLIIVIIISSNLVMPKSFTPPLLMLIIAVIWQFSPIKQRFLNLGHEHCILSAFGFSAFRDAWFYGLSHGLWCVGAGWALMLFPMLLPKGHNLAMLIVTFIMLSEHLEHPKYPRWRIVFRLRLIKIVLIQSRMQLIYFIKKAI